MADVLPSGAGISLGASSMSWQNTLDLTKMSNLFGLYPSKGDVTYTADYNVPSTLDGPIQVVRYGNLGINAAANNVTITTTQRCRGLIILCDSLTMSRTASYVPMISMSARGAAGTSKWVNQSILMPTNVKLSGMKTDWRTFAAWLASTGYFVADPNLWVAPVPGMGDVLANYTSWPGTGTPFVAADGCGAALGLQLYNGAGVLTGATGNPGTTGPASGGGGTGGGGLGNHNNPSNGSYNTISPPGSAGWVWGGGAGGPGISPYGASTVLDLYGGKGGGSHGAGYGGGAGNPSGSSIPGNSGTGGILIVVCRGAINLAAGAVLSANGVSGEYGANCSGGSSGGGVVAMFYGSVTANSATFQANGGPGVSGYGGYLSGAGGAGTAGASFNKTLATMGWS